MVVVVVRQAIGGDRVSVCLLNSQHKAGEEEEEGRGEVGMSSSSFLPSVEDDSL